MVARFLHYFPQYQLADLMSGSLPTAEFMYLYGGMLDVECPRATEPFAVRVERATREAHLKAVGKQKRGGW